MHSAYFHGWGIYFGRCDTPATSVDLRLWRFGAGPKATGPGQAMAAATGRRCFRVTELDAGGVPGVMAFQSFRGFQRREL